MELQKLKIETYARLNEGPLDTFQVLFNPTEYSIEEASKWQEQDRNRRDPELQYTGGDRRKLSMELFFDTYETKEDVRIYTGKFTKLLVASIDTSNGKRPPLVKVIWGEADPDPTSGVFPFFGVLESLKQQFVLFANNGTPRRAKLTVSFKEFSLPVDELQREPPNSSFPRQTYTLKVGETLSGVAATLWKDPLRWRLLAEANDIDNPRSVRPAQVLVVPAID